MGPTRTKNDLFGFDLSMVYSGVLGLKIAREREKIKIKKHIIYKLGFKNFN